MRRLSALLLCLTLMLALPVSSLAATRALLVACSDFLTQPSLGNAVSGNLQMIGSALLGANPRLAGLSIEDGTIGSPDALGSAMEDAFAEAAEGDLSILYLCTHGVLSADDGSMFLLLGDGEAESMLTADQLAGLLSPIQGEKLLIVDACYSGALLSRGKDSPSPFFADPSIHVLTSASADESSWYFNSEHLSTGAVSYFASALSSGLGLYGAPEADVDGDGAITLEELHRYLRVAVPSSSSQLLSDGAQALELPAVQRAMLSRPLGGFSYGESLLLSDDPTLDFSFTVTRETQVHYRLIDYDAGDWNWENVKTFTDAGDDGSGTLTPGRKNRTLTLTDVAPEESGYVMLQIFAVSGEEVILCSERLIAVQPAAQTAALEVACAASYAPDEGELSISIHAGVPAEITLSVFDSEGALVRRLFTSQLTRPSASGVTLAAWDGRGADGGFVPAGEYTIAAEAVTGGTRCKAASNVTIAEP